ncbi:6-carboxytetrahydropterin synthase [Wukongibacter baidiensis]|uniref:6-carboxytetrahydropterin synthase n=1 Tax=Wukongibacter baidiensis TaxID=1723361 RepID=UPI003D7FD2CC
MKTYYRFKFYINARHSVIFDDKASNIHPHTWEIAISFGSRTTEIVNFSQFEKELDKYFANYEGKYLNELEEFMDVNPTMENIGKILYKDIKKLLDKKDLYFKTVEISENPTRTYIIEAQ